MTAKQPFGDGVSAVAEATHELLWVRGPDAVSYLDGLLSQNVASMLPGQVARSLLLAPNGKLRALLWILRGETDVGIVADRGYGVQVAGDLERFRLRVDAAIEDEVIPLFSVVGETSDGWVTDGEGITIGADLGAVPRRLTDEIPAGAAVLEPDHGEALRIEAGEPRMGRDVDESTIPQESGLVAAAVDFDKGCYLGQELVARIDSRGHVNRRLAAVVADSPLPVGATVMADGAEAGIVTSVAWSPFLDAQVGMGLLRREAGDGAAVDLRWDGGSATGEIRSLPLVLHSANSH